MCTMSMVMDWGRDEMKRWPTSPVPLPSPTATPVPMPSAEELQAFIRVFEDLMERAKEYDRLNNEPDCEMDEKRLAIKKIADELGVKIKFISDNGSYENKETQ